ncbi:MAG TPA: hypothetical protein VN607_10060 [Gemmatimonadaceae bacterium]|nr:hypothetical protein [Gemmatimonadaceae bacterium]
MRLRFDDGLVSTRHARAACLTLVCIAAAACSGHKDGGPQVQQASDATNGDPCSLLDTSEVIAAVGPLAGPPYNQAYSSDVCEYDTKDYRRLLVTGDWSGGKMSMKMSNLGRQLSDKALQAQTQTGTVLKSGDTLRGSWDQVAMAPATCCGLNALKADRMVGLDWTGTKLTMAQASALLETAIKRLDHPLGINGAAGKAAAQQRLAAMAQDSSLDVCTLVSATDAAAILGPLAKPPDHGSPQAGPSIHSCYYYTPMPAANGAPPPPDAIFTYEIDLKEWHDAHTEFASDQFVIQGGVNGMRKQLMGADSLPTPVEPPGPWDDLGSSVAGGYEAVKGPFLLTANAMGDHDKLRALLAKAVSALK